MQSVLGAMAMMNMEGEGISDVRDYFRQKLLKMGVVQPTEAEAEELMMAMQNQQPDPNASIPAGCGRRGHGQGCEG